MRSTWSDPLSQRNQIALKHQLKIAQYPKLQIALYQWYEPLRQINHRFLYNPALSAQDYREMSAQIERLYQEFNYHFQFQDDPVNSLANFFTEESAQITKEETARKLERFSIDCPSTMSVNTSDLLFVNVLHSRPKTVAPKTKKSLCKRKKGKQ